MRIKVFFLIGALTGLSLVLGNISQARQVTYLPRDYNMSTKTVKYGTSYNARYRLTEQDCPADQGLFETIDNLGRCLEVLQDCPDCCLDFDNLYEGRPIIKPAPIATDDAIYFGQATPLFSINDDSKICASVRNCTQLRNEMPNYFPKENCAVDWGQALPEDVLDIAHCQERGCPGWDVDLGIYAVPYISMPGITCYPVGLSGSAYSKIECNYRVPSNPVPIKTECVRIQGNSCGTSYYQNLGNPHPCSWNTGQSCWYYEFTDTFRTCIEACVNKARGFERYERSADCFYNGDAICSDEYDPGFARNCVVGPCQERISWQACLLDPEDQACCDNLVDAADEALSEIQDQANACFDPGERGGGACLDCFRKFEKADGDLFYDFVARSDHRVVVLSQVQAEPRYCWSDDAALSVCPTALLNAGRVPSAALYTMIKVFDITDPEDVFEVFPGRSGRGMVFPAFFTGSMFSSGATVVSGLDATGSPFLRQGHKYRVRLYWYIPRIEGVLLYVDATYGGIVVLQTR